MKQTPEIVIPRMKINSCDVCPFLRESPDFFDEKIKRSCGHRDRSSWDDMNEWNFETIPNSDIWIHCPLPDVKEEN